MKICTITCHNVYNHGALLQAWALATYLNSQGEECSIIDYQPDYLCGQYDLKVNNDKYDCHILKWLYLLAKYPFWRYEIRRKKNFDAFFSKHIKPLLTPVRYASVAELRSNPPRSEAFVAGSDQIWNTFVPNGNDAAFYLDFGVETTKRISYAASFSTDTLAPDSQKFVTGLLSKFDSISVRESSGIAILKSMGFSGEVVADPVFLIDLNKWNSISAKCAVPPKYILVYDTNRSKDIEILANRLSKSKGWPIYSISGFHLPYASGRYRMGGPDIFLSLIKNAECVISNSFHASAFSIIFNRDFIVVKRPDGLNRRMEDLLSCFGLSSRLMGVDETESNLSSHIDYTYVNARLVQFRHHSAEWLGNALHNHA